MNEYLRHYQTLGIQPGCTWIEMKDAYRRLAKAWHPDHFERDHLTKKKAIAEDKIKEINKAFRTLSNYYKKFGRLPVDAEDTPVTEAPSPTYPSESDSPTSDEWSNHVKKPGVSNPWRYILVGILLGGAYALWNASNQDLESLESYNTPAGRNPLLQGIEETSSSTKQHNKQNNSNNYFTVGSTLGEVYAVQGVPTKIEDNVWHYGHSKVFFSNGAVSEWKEDTDNPLKTQINFGQHKSSTKIFGIGSTKTDVRALQGTPIHESENVWDYGLAKVFFDGSKVSGWQDSPMQPLKIHK
jgi:hypothetical protein